MKRGTIVLTPFPFTDLSGQKVRPALVVSRSDRPGNDVVLSFITSHRGQALLPTDLLIENRHPDFARIGLKAASIIKLDKLVTLERSVLLGELGELLAALLRQVDEKLKHGLDL